MILTSKHPLLTLSQEFAMLCKPLELFNITHITYQKQFKNGARISLSNKPQWIEDYYNLSLYSTSLFESQDAVQADFSVWLGEYDLDVYKHGKLYYNTACSISVTEPVHDGYEVYIFATAGEHAKAIQYLSNHKEIIYHFILYLKDRGKKLLNVAEQNSLLLPKPRVLEEANLAFLINEQEIQTMQQLKNQFFKSTPVYKYSFEKGPATGVKLTHRELLCLAYLLNNKTAEETANLMNLSRRTVESYLNNIRTKLNIDNKSLLLQQLKANRLLAAIIE